ncbi:Tumor necrosis factor receptor superfamily member 16 [Schistosoma japonicum]|uniref:Tumor necrosis factor receptor superfamily member 16 n=1 Tax=Schistosoma japonicum TaxID=6182 RepID=A0A4Z2CWW4_SCHJA|nr:Tumor necrosis factor receptor superfamily member 16 [Schistosoma japonicum]
MTRVYQIIHFFNINNKQTSTCVYTFSIFIELLYFIIIWNSVLAGPFIFQIEHMEKKNDELVNITSQLLENNKTTGRNNYNETETTTPGTTDGTGDVVEIQTETCNDPYEEFVSPVHGTPRCCRKCEPGTGMLRLCSNKEDTQCRPCKPGFEFSPIRSATKKCLQCRRCEELHPLAKTRTECTPITDTICQCEKLYYMSEKEQTCKPCTVCQPGEGIVKACSWNSDTQCQSCPAGFWSAQTIDNVKCIPCQSCGKDQVLVRQCSSISDTLCCPLNNPNCTHELSSDYSTYDQDGDIPENGNKSNQMLPIYCSIMGLIIISLLCYVVYKLWRQREASKNAKLTDSYNITIGCNKTDLLDRTSCLDNHHLQQQRISPGFVNTAITNINNNTNVSNHSPQSISEIDKIVSVTSDNNNNNQYNDLTVGHEKAPLLGTSDNSNKNYEQPVTGIPLNILGVICYRLSQNGWRELASTMNLDTSQFNQLPLEVTSDLLSAAMEAQTNAESQLKSSHPNNSNTLQQTKTDNNHENDLRMTVSMFRYICIQNTVNLGQLINYLHKINRSDLVGLLQQQQTGTMKTKKSSEEHKNKTK